MQPMQSLRRLVSRNEKLTDEDTYTILMAIDEVELEVSERYMPLPVDADGVPIHIGDKLRSDELPGREFTCLGFNVTQLNGVPWWTVEWRYDDESGTSEYVSAKSCHHVKPHTLTDVLADLFDRKMTITDAEHELRDLLGGDAE